MKRRTIDASKFRRPVKRSRITDSVNGSCLLYLRYFIIWLLIITMDFVLEFRFEFLWPFWLLVRSSFDSFKYQGLGLTILFLCITLFSDTICFLLLPTHWLFFVASTYVWVQFVCNTDRGPCVATVCLWLLFVYVEASVRLREVKSVPFHLDLCRPFAAHCIGYPVVSLGYGFKSYLGYRIKHYQQVEVSKQNQFYQQLVSYALPPELNEEQLISRKPITNGIPHNEESTSKQRKEIEEKTSSSLSLNDLEVISSSAPVKEVTKQADVGFVRVKQMNYRNVDVRRSKTKKKSDESDEEESENDESTTSNRSHDNSPKTLIRHNQKESNHLKMYKDEQALRRKAESQVSQLEYTLKKLRSELQTKRDVELRSPSNVVLFAERSTSTETDQSFFDHQKSSYSKSQEKLLIASLERKLKVEKELRLNVESQMVELKKKQELNKSNEADDLKRGELEVEVAKLKTRLSETTASISDLKRENGALKQLKSSENGREKLIKEVDFLKKTLNNIQAKNMHLEGSLSSETRLKLDLFSALGETRRTLEIVQNQLKAKYSEVESLKAKIAEVMAVTPAQYHSLLNGFNYNESSEYSGKSPNNWANIVETPEVAN